MQVDRDACLSFRKKAGTGEYVPGPVGRVVLQSGERTQRRSAQPPSTIPRCVPDEGYALIVGLAGGTDFYFATQAEGFQAEASACFWKCSLVK